MRIRVPVTKETSGLKEGGVAGLELDEFRPRNTDLGG